jgi:hypothetical protein
MNVLEFENILMDGLKYKKDENGTIRGYFYDYVFFTGGDYPFDLDMITKSTIKSLCEDHRNAIQNLNNKRPPMDGHLNVEKLYKTILSMIRDKKIINILE